MELATIDYLIVFGFFAVLLGIGVSVAGRSGKDTEEFFLSGRSSPWWLLGVSMVATTFSTDTPNLVTDIVRTNGVSGNWVWWAFLLTGMLTVFIYAKLWRRSGVLTDLEFYELRYGGKPARFLRYFRSVYLGLAFNVLMMSAVTLAAIKIGQVMLGLSPLQTVGLAGLVTVVFSSVAGFRGVIYTDCFLFVIAMIGAIGAAYFSVNHEAVGGLSQLLSHPNVVDKTSIFPDFNNTEALITLMIVPLAVQWWSAWYPGSEPGGGGYVAQRMLAAKDENHATIATLAFNIMHYALRPWAWILVALASLIVFPDIASIQDAFPGIAEDKLGNDLAYPAMLTLLPSGLLGIVLASLMAAYVSTVSTHLNWGASYLVNDFYKQTFGKDASEKSLVMAGRVCTVLLMVVAIFMALSFTNAKQVFDVILMFGAGSGLIFLLRWFWWRINAWSEITAMFVSGLTSTILTFTPVGGLLFGSTGLFESYYSYPFVVLVTTTAWIAVTYLTSPESEEVLKSFYKQVQPGGRGWDKVVNDAKAEGEDIGGNVSGVLEGLSATVISTLMVYFMMFATGAWLYGQTIVALILTTLAVISAFLLMRTWKRMRVTNIIEAPENK